MEIFLRKTFGQIIAKIERVIFVSSPWSPCRSEEYCHVEINPTVVLEKKTIITRVNILKLIERTAAGIFRHRSKLPLTVDCITYIVENNFLKINKI